MAQDLMTHGGEKLAGQLVEEITRHESDIETYAMKIAEPSERLNLLKSLSK